MSMKRTPIEDRLWSRVQKTDTCWLWQGPVNESGYGVISTGGREGLLLRTHRLAYELLVGPIPEGMHLDHVWDRGCRHKNCCNQAHLEPVTQSENMDRAVASRATCRRGHPYDEANTYLNPQGHRYCRACRAVRESS